MARKKVSTTLPVRISVETLAAVRIASGYTGESVPEYLSRIALERATQDIARSSAAWAKAKRTAKD